MKKILLPIYLNHHNCDAIDYAVKFFKREVCEFYFLNTYNYNVQGLNAIQLLQADEDWFERPKLESQKRLGRLIKNILIIVGIRITAFMQFQSATDLSLV